MNTQDLAKLEAELLFCDAQIMFGQAAIKKYEIEKLEILQKIRIYKESKIEKREIYYTDDGETMLVKKKNNDDCKKEVSNITKNSSAEVKNTTKLENHFETNGIVSPEFIKDSDMEKSGIPFKFLLEDTIIDMINEKIPDFEDSPLNEPIPELTRTTFYEELDNNNMTIDKLSNILETKIDYNYGDFINFDDYRYGNMFIVGKNGVLYRNPDNSSSGGISIPLVISQFLYDSVDKYKDVANDIDVGCKDNILNQYVLNDNDKQKLKFYWVMDDELIAEDKNGKNVDLIIAKQSKDEKVDKQKVKKVETKKSTVSKQHITIKYGSTVVFTGGKDKKLLEIFEKYDIKIGSTVSKNTCLLIAKDKNENSTKLQKAKDLDIPIYTVEEFNEAPLNVIQ